MLNNQCSIKIFSLNYSVSKMAEYSATLNTVIKWEKEFNCKLEKEMTKGKVTKIKCSLCKKFAGHLNKMRSYTDTWIEGTKSVKKDTLKKHLTSDVHVKAVDLDTKERLGASSYTKHVLQKSRIGQGLTRMAEQDKEFLRVCFNTAYYLVKQERPFSDYPALLSLQFKNGVKEFKCYRNDRAAAGFTDSIASVLKEDLVKDLLNARYFSILTDGSTDTAVIEEELVYVLLLNNEGYPNVKFLSIESPEHTDAGGLKDAINSAFSRIGLLDFSSRLHGLNVDGAAVNTGIHRGLATLLRENSPWLTVVHCFNHRFELAIKDACRNFFDEIDTFLNKLFYLYKKSSKRLRELREFGEMFEKSIPKPAKVGGTRWIAHKFRAMIIVLQNYGIFISHLESLAHTDSQTLKKAEIEGFAKKWQYARFPLHLALYLDVLTPLKVLSLSMQKDEHDPVTMLRRVQEFSWTMVKLQGLISTSVSGSSGRLTNYTKFIEEVSQDDEGNMVYQHITLKEFHSSKCALENSLGEVVAKMCRSVEQRFGDFRVSAIYKHLISLLDVNTWPEDEDSLMAYGDDAINDLVELWKELLERNGCVAANIPVQWDRLKIRVRPMLVGGSNSVKYLDIWARILMNNDVKNECSDVLHIIELLLITPFTNAKLERMFSRMKRVKTEWRNKLGRDKLDSCLRIGEEGSSIDEFNPNEAISSWYEQSVRRVAGAKPHKYPKRRKTSGNSSSTVVDVARYTLSDLEYDSDSESD